MSNARDKANIPALNFSSTGIDDNATSTAITIDSSQNVDVNGTVTADGLTVAGNVSIDGGTINLVPLTASKGVFTDASKNLTSTGILTSDQGGTGNGFTKFSGATSSEKTYTLPNANQTLAGLETAQTFTALQTINSARIIKDRGLFFASYIASGSADFDVSIITDSVGNNQNSPSCIFTIVQSNGSSNQRVQFRNVMFQGTGTNLYVSAPYYESNFGTISDNLTYSRPSKNVFRITTTDRLVKFSLFNVAS